MPRRPIQRYQIAKSANENMVMMAHALLCSMPYAYLYIIDFRHSFSSNRALNLWLVFFICSSVFVVVVVVTFEYLRTAINP